MLSNNVVLFCRSKPWYKVSKKFTQREIMDLLFRGAEKQQHNTISRTGTVVFTVSNSTKFLKP